MIQIIQIFRRLDRYLAKPYRSRRWIVGICVGVSLLLCIYANLRDQELRGETLLTALATGGVGMYGASRILGHRGPDPTPETDPLMED